jgi:acetylornithine deacetylase/succinyl-diaminopimelate desuccinylase-like protein
MSSVPWPAGWPEPRIHPEAWVAASAVVIGDVQLAAGASLWPTAVARGDVCPIVVGEGSNVQDGAVLHGDPDQPVIAGAVPDAVATVGQLAPSPGATNVIPGRAVFSLDVRSPRDADRTQVAASILDECRAIAARRKIGIEVVQTHELASCACAPWLQAQLAAAIGTDGHRVVELPSGAGHDAMAMVALADVAMLFLRCREGISHHPAESITAEDAATGMRVLQSFIEHFEPRR